MKISKINEFGRSMIEMLGVLAIIGVLSVGAIAGYQKAMMKYKSNGFINAYSQLIGNLSLYAEQFAKMNDGAAYDIDSMLNKLNLIPDGMYYEYPYIYEKYFKSHNRVIVGGKSLAIEVFISDDSKTSYRSEICKMAISNLAIPIHDSINMLWIYRGSGNSSGSQWWGDKNCTSNKKCLKDMTLSDVEQVCNECIKDSTCLININLYQLD